MPIITVLISARNDVVTYCRFHRDSKEANISVLLEDERCKCQIRSAYNEMKEFYHVNTTAAKIEFSLYFLSPLIYFFDLGK